MPTDNEFTRILQWPGYCVYRQQIDEKHKSLDLWVRRKRGNRKLACSGCGRQFETRMDLQQHEKACPDVLAIQQGNPSSPPLTLRAAGGGRAVDI